MDTFSQKRLTTTTATVSITLKNGPAAFCVSCLRLDFYFVFFIGDAKASAAKSLLTFT